MIEKNGALNGVRTIVTLIPELRVGIAVFASKQLTVFPEAVRAEFLERELGPSGRDLQAEVRGQQAAWQSLVDLPKPPGDARQLAHGLQAYAGRYASALYGEMTVAPDGGGLGVTIGPANYKGRLSPWSGDTFIVSWENVDIPAGLLEFAFAPGSANATEINGSQVPNAFTSNYGHFERLP